MKRNKKLGEIIPIAHAEGEDRYSSVRIWSSDQTLLRIKTAAEKDKENEHVPARYDTHQFETVTTQRELAQYIEYSDEEDTGRRIVSGFFVGVLRGYRQLEARADCPEWILNSSMFRAFISRQESKARAAAVLFLHYRCYETDSDIAETLGDSEEAIKKFRQRLMLQGNAFFRSPKKLAA